MSGKNCPTQEELSAYLLGRLQPQTWEVICEHVDQCRACQGVLETLPAAADPLLAQLRLPAPVDEYADEPECR
jgi:predicted anti-sigma-YlaC factor YlaD